MGVHDERLAPTGGNTRLEVYKPMGMDGREGEFEELAAPPAGFRLQGLVQAG